MAPNHLVIVCGHAIWLGGRKNGWEEAEWLIEGYKQGETPTFIEHIKAGVQVLSEDESAVLAFSGWAHTVLELHFRRNAYQLTSTAAQPAKKLRSPKPVATST